MNAGFRQSRFGGCNQVFVNQHGTQIEPASQCCANLLPAGLPRSSSLTGSQSPATQAGTADQFTDSGKALLVDFALIAVRMISLEIAKRHLMRFAPKSKASANRSPDRVAIADSRSLTPDS
jgi:hypothetical protein